MTNARFDVAKIATLVEELKTATEFRACCSDLYNPELHIGGVVRDNQGRAKSDPLFSYPDSGNIDKTKLEPQFWLVKDSGLYLMSNAVKKEGSGRSYVVYAAGCDPEQDPDCHENSAAIFGGDDGVITLPVSWYDYAKEKNKRVFNIKFSGDSISLNL
ncbi:DUF3085 domain-containing protein [Photobacterium kishitanii]|uniref:DUF3085 domain-containing protein n=1 Tax=Photobacterium kishitanii TaxID=318456 RepID=A0A2T3KKS1_9GAMM|nr:DUF3085 domain-containing protein [Photobacterium kishitanii]PSV00318.1 hypothetical protein C9J27_04120 [Photobacterium kishitanii]